MSDRRTVYVVEDDPDVRRIIVRTLVEYCYDVHEFRTGGELLRGLKARTADLCIVDLGLPDIDGMSLVRTISGPGAPAILILTGRQALSDRVVGLELGADDYVVKPFEPRELVARVRSLLRRTGRDQAEERGTVARFAGWALDTGVNQLIAPGGERQDLSAAEARLLVALLRAPKRILSREQLLPDHADAPTDRSIDVRISRLRRKIEPDPRDPTIIKTVYGAGYLFTADVAWD